MSRAHLRARRVPQSTHTVWVLWLSADVFLASSPEESRGHSTSPVTSPPTGVESLSQPLWTKETIRLGDVSRWYCGKRGYELPLQHKWSNGTKIASQVTLQNVGDLRILAVNKDYDDMCFCRELRTEDIHLLINYRVLVPCDHAYNARIEDDHRRSVCEPVSSVAERSDGVVTNPNFEWTRRGDFPFRSLRNSTDWSTSWRPHWRGRSIQPCPRWLEVTMII